MVLRWTARDNPIAVVNQFTGGQVAQIVVMRTDETPYRGSGYQISSDAILTARHVVSKASSIDVFFFEDKVDGGRIPASVLWVGADYDLAVLKLSRERSHHVTPAAFARLGHEGREIEVRTAGFPRWKMREADGEKFRDLHYGRGTVALLSNVLTGTLEIRMDASPAADPDPKVSPWEAMSGAAVWAAGHIVGVVAEHHLGEGLATLTGMRIDEPLRDGVDASGERLSTVLDVDPASLPDATAVDKTSEPVSAVAPLSLYAYRVPLSWRPDGTPCPVSDAYAADLGALLCLDRGPTTTVVAARPRTALAEALTAVEQGPIHDGSGAGRDFSERVWRRARLTDAESALRDRAAGAGTPGLVVDWPLEKYPAGVPTNWSAREVVARIRAEAEDAPVVILVEAAEAVDGIAAAALIGRQIGPAAQVFALTRPGDIDEAPVAGRVVASGGGNGHRLMATVAAHLRDRSLPSPPYPHDGEPLGSDADPVEVAESVVTMLNRTEAWGPYDLEARAIRLVRDYAPRYFSVLLGHHAAARRGPARWCSLAAAAPIDDHVAIWLEKASQVGSPSHMPRLLRDGATIEAVLLGLLRSGAEEAAGWMDAAANGRCPAAWELAAFLVADRPPAGFLVDARAEGAIAAARAEKHELLNAEIPAPAASEAWWAAIARRPLTKGTVATLVALSPESRRIAAFTADRREPDPEFAELVVQMRTAMLPPLRHGKR